jgi:ABC-type transport system substrate-binding protein
MAESIQQTLGQAGIKLEIIPGDGKQTLTKYRARQHDLYIGQWGSDYQDPNSNADTFAANDDNSDDAKAKPLAWRNAWDPGPLTAQTRAAVLEPDAEKRAKMYEDLQKEVLAKGPYIGQWGQDYFDPNSNAQTFASNTDNSDEGKNKTLAWRNAWDVPDLTKKTEAALLEKDSAKRADMYKELLQTVLDTSPFVIIFQQTEVAAIRGNLKGFKLGPSFDTNFVGPVSKE